MDPKDYIDGLRSQNRRALARTITLIESRNPFHRDTARTVVDEILPYTGKAVRLGITGVPGVGKSTFIESFGTMVCDMGHKVAVLAVDPSSTRSGGSILADKTRMEKLSIEPNAFIRPSPSGGTLGGVARMTRETMLVCEAAGFDVILIETVGVGQNETTVVSMVDFFLVLMLAGAGDELQGIKKGVLELADALTINKADGDNIEKAEKARKAYEMALHLLNPATPTWSPPVKACSATEMTGLKEIWEMVLDHRSRFVKTGELEAKRRKQALDWMWDLINQGLKDSFNNNFKIRKRLEQVTDEVERGRTSPTVAAYELLLYMGQSVY